MQQTVNEINDTKSTRKFQECKRQSATETEIPVDLINLQKISKVKTTKDETIKQLNKENKNIVLLFIKDIQSKTGMNILNDFEKSYKSLMQLNTIPILITHEMNFNQNFFPHKFSVIYDQQQEFFEFFGVLNRNATFMIQNFEIVNYYISPIDSNSSINFWRLVIDPDGTSKIKKRNIQGRTSIHIKSPFNNTEKSRNLNTRTSIHIKTPFSDSRAKNEKYEQKIDEEKIDDFNEEDGFIGGLNNDFGRFNSRRIKKMEDQRKENLEMKSPNVILTPLGEDDDFSYNNTSSYSTPTPNMTPTPNEEINKNKENILAEEELNSPNFADELKFNQYFSENVNVVQTENKRKYSIASLKISGLFENELDFGDETSPSSNRDTNNSKSDLSSARKLGEESPTIDQCLSDNEDEEEVEEEKTIKKNRSFSNLFTKDTGSKKLLKSQSISNLFLHMNKRKKDIKEIKKKKSIMEFNYLDIYANQRYFQFFKLYLASEYSLENALFLESVDEYVEETNEFKRKEICKIIIDEFFEENSLKEINISNSVKNKIRKEYEIENFNDSLFEKIVLELKNGIMQDSFSRFILSPYFEDMLSEKK
eukprot:gene6874-11036_t